MSSLIESVVLSLLYRIKLPFQDILDDEVQTEKVLGIKEMALPISAGILSALRRVIARCVSLKNQPKGRLNAITIASATCFLFPVAMWDMIIGSPSSTSDKVSFSTWAFLSTILFGVILIFYVDSIAEESTEGSPSSTSDKVSFSTWAFLSTILFGVILIFYVDSIAEERLHMVFSSPRHLMVAGGCIIIMELCTKWTFLFQASLFAA
ncbi:hypothetical protein C1H46_041307 [Malus baccata]|uniref:Uncharacterized protein n=1 Tax=Malus baccata TaxID=106549 RepID=A0A540KFZ8_MALBA|nr:hypothetical protein C1H46_041307 [Malus baccata]